MMACTYSFERAAGQAGNEAVRIASQHSVRLVKQQRSEISPSTLHETTWSDILQLGRSERKKRLQMKRAVSRMCALKFGKLFC